MPCPTGDTSKPRAGEQQGERQSGENSLGCGGSERCLQAARAGLRPAPTEGRDEIG